MPYIIANSDGTIIYTVADNTVDETTFDLAMIGQGVSNYGEFQAQNTLRHLENFASAAAPDSPVIGQLWYDKASDIMRVWDGDLWRASTGIAIGPENTRPRENLAGTTFFNTSNNKLEIHDGTRFKEAAYAGEVTSRFSSDFNVQSPTFYGARVRTLFLKSEDNRSIPVLAFSYVKSGSNPENRGATRIGEQYETIMGLYSDEQFFIRDTGAGGTATPVDGVIVDFAPELLATDEGSLEAVGIAAGRVGRERGLILRGLNNRAEYDETSVAFFGTIFANVIGTPSRPIDSIEVLDLNVRNTIDFAQDVNITGTLNVGTDVNVDGIITASGSNSTTWANAVTFGANISLLNNDADYLETSELASALTNASILTEPNLLATLGISDLTDIITTSSAVSELVNDGDFLTGASIQGDGTAIVWTPGTGTISLNEPPGLTAGTYGAANTSVRLTVDDQGRVTGIQQFLIDGSAIGGNLTLTDFSVTTNAPAGGGALAYNDSNGVFTFTPAAGISVETDPVFVASPAGNIAGGDITNWDTAFSWGDHALAGYANASIVPENISDLSDVNTAGATPGQTLVFSGGSWQPTTLAIGSGDVVGPASSVNLTIPVFSGATGKLLTTTTRTMPGVGGLASQLVGLQDTQTLSGKSFSDAVRFSAGAGDTEIEIGAGSRLAFNVNTTERMHILTNGFVGINIPTAGYELHVGGQIFATDNITAFSDARLKDNIETLDGSKVFAMRGVSYTKDGKPGAGVIAQEMLEVAPELVDTQSEYMGVNYGNLGGYLIEAIKDLKAELDSVKAELAELKNASAN